MDTAPFQLQAAVGFAPGDGFGGEGWHLNTKRPEGAFVYLHGLADDSFPQTLMDCLRNEWEKGHVGDVDIVVPLAQRRSVKIFYGLETVAWSDLETVDPDRSEDVSGFRESSMRIQGIIYGLMGRGIPAAKIAVAGFSQGAATAWLTASAMQVSIGYCFAIAGWYPCRAEKPWEKQEQWSASPPAEVSGSSDGTEYVLLHNPDDKVVDIRYMKESADLFKKACKGAKLEIVEGESGYGHSFSPKISLLLVTKTTQLFKGSK